MVLEYNERFPQRTILGSIVLPQESSRMEYILKYGSPGQDEESQDSLEMNSVLSTKFGRVTRREFPETYLPNLHQRKKSENCLKRTRRVYLSRVCHESLESSVPKIGQSVELPGIHERRRRTCRGSNYCPSAGSGSQKTCGAVGNPISFPGNSSSEFEGDSLASGAESTSPRRKIRVPSPLVKNESSGKFHQSPSAIPDRRAPRPPTTPRKVFLPRPPVTPKGVDEVVLSSDDSDVDLEFESKPASRPKTPALRKVRHYQATLQNIQEHCDREGSIRSSSQDRNMETGKGSRGIVTAVESPNYSRRKSTGAISCDRDCKNPARERISRRLSMPEDMHEMRKHVQGIRFVNIREFSRDVVQEFLSRREDGPVSGPIGNDRRQKKCLTWLQSLEQSQ